MRRLIFTAAVLVFLAVPAGAQSDSIRVIDEDGSVQEVKIPKRPAAKATAEPAPARKIAPESAARPEPEQKPQAAASSVATGPVEFDLPRPKSPLVEKLKPAEPETRKTPVSRPVPSAPVDANMPLPPRKGQPLGRDYPWEYWPEPGAPEIPPGRQVSRDLALAIALENAPPARSVHVLPRTHEGKPVFVVRFKTENGPHDVIIDRRSGEIITSGL